MEHNKLIAIDLAKSVFQVCMLGNDNNIISNKKLSRKELHQFLAQQELSTVAMEACYSSHYWGRICLELGHDPKLIPAQHVKPFLRGNKNDANDALAIAEAAKRPGLRFVPIKSSQQQGLQSLHRIRERLTSSRRNLSNQTRGLLSEYGVILPKGYGPFKKGLAAALDDSRLSDLLKQQLQCIYQEFGQLSTRLLELNKQICAMANQSSECQLLMTIPGIGPIISTAMVGSIDVKNHFRSAREFAVWLGLTPRQSGSGGRSVMLGITKRGDRYLRKQLIHGARAAMRTCRGRDDQFSQWVNSLIARRGLNKACVALAHKLARLSWILLQRKEPFAYGVSLRWQMSS
jgi:transposase